MDFYSNIHQWYHYIFPLNPAQVNWVCNEINLGNTQIIEIGCATGSLAFALYAAGYKVKAIDLDKSMIAFARKEQGHFNADLTFTDANMLDIESEFRQHLFDGATCFGNTIVHLTTSKLIGQFFKSVFNVLKPNGKFLFQVVNYDRILRQRPSQLPLIDNDFIRFERFYAYKTNGLIDFSTRLTIKENGWVIDSCVPIFPLCAQEINSLLAKAGFSNVELYGGFNDEEFTPDSFPLVVKATKG